MSLERFSALFEVAFASVTLTNDVAAQEKGLNSMVEFSFNPKFHETMYDRGMLNYLTPFLNSHHENHQILTISILTNLAHNGYFYYCSQ